MHAYLFPGQGSQFVGMGRILYDTYVSARALFDQADQVVGFNLSDRMFNGTEEDLQKTQVTQPAIFVCSTLLAVVSPYFKPGIVAGHSLGEFSALVAAGVIGFETGLRLVVARASFMSEACKTNPGGMAAVLGLSDEVVEKICRELDLIVFPANYNAPGQLVISGTLAAIQQAGPLLQVAGAKKIAYLKVEGAFHSPLMNPAKEALRDMIEQVPFATPLFPVYQNFSGLPTTDPAILKKNLIEQLTSPLLWKQTINKMVEDGVTSFIECGPGNVLQALVKKIVPGVAVTALV